MSNCSTHSANIFSSFFHPTANMTSPLQRLYQSRAFLAGQPRISRIRLISSMLGGATVDFDMLLLGAGRGGAGVE